MEKASRFATAPIEPFAIDTFLGEAYEASAVLIERKRPLKRNELLDEGKSFKPFHPLETSNELLDFYVFVLEFVLTVTTMGHGG